jgi:hypothetical protein
MSTVKLSSVGAFPEFHDSSGNECLRSVAAALTIKYDLSGNHAVYASINIASVTSTTSGASFTFIEDMPDTDYNVVAMSGQIGTAPRAIGVLDSTKATTGFTTVSRKDNDTFADDTGCIMVFR